MYERNETLERMVKHIELASKADTFTQKERYSYVLKGCRVLDDLYNLYTISSATYNYYRGRIEKASDVIFE